VDAYTNQNGVLVPASGVKPIRSKSVDAKNVFTGPALSYKPFDDLLLRGSIASGYVPPTYAQLLPNAVVVPTISNSLIDPNTGAKVPGVQVYSLGGNTALKPSSSRSYDLGAVWEPKFSFLKGLRVDAEFTETKQNNLIFSPSAQDIVNLQSTFPNLVVRDSTGKLTTVYTQYINIAEYKQDAWTFSFDYPWRSAIGSFELTAQETIQEHNQRQIAIGTIPLEFVGFPNSGGVAKTKSTGSLRWSWHNWVAQWTVTNVDSYNQYGAPNDPGAYATALETNKPYRLNTQYTLAQGGNTVPSQTYHNFYLSYSFPKGMFRDSSRFGHWSNAFFDGMKISLVVNNVFNTMPPFDPYYQPFYASPFGDVQLRNYALTLKKSF
jgi:outer membrane receptor protein involved in Fe transport